MVTSISKPKKLIFKNGKRVLVDFDEVSRTEYDKQYNRRRAVEKPDYLKFYHSTQWQKVRAEAMTRDLDLCVRCGNKGYLVDHIVPSEDDWSNRYDIDNLETLCKKCHQLKTKREWTKRHKGVQRAMKVHVISGYPGSGMPSYVASRVDTSHDLVFDYDLLMSSLNGNLIESIYSDNDNQSNSQDKLFDIKSRLHQSNVDIYEYVELIYEIILRKLRTERTFNNVWILRTFPDERLKNLLVTTGYDVEYLRLDTTREECTRRLKTVGRYTDSMSTTMDKIDRLDDEGLFDDYKLIKTKKEKIKK